ncbi:hypothetical protein ACFL1U_00655 [Patescibacteria group bacterium]
MTQTRFKKLQSLSHKPVFKVGLFVLVIAVASGIAFTQYFDTTTAATSTDPEQGIWTDSFTDDDGLESTSDADEGLVQIQNLKINSALDRVELFSAGSQGSAIAKIPPIAVQNWEDFSVSGGGDLVRFYVLYENASGDWVRVNKSLLPDDTVKFGNNDTGYKFTGGNLNVDISALSVVDYPALRMQVVFPAGSSTDYLDEWTLNWLPKPGATIDVLMPATTYGDSMMRIKIQIYNSGPTLENTILKVNNLPIASCPDASGVSISASNDLVALCQSPLRDADYDGVEPHLYRGPNDFGNSKGDFQDLNIARTPLPPLDGTDYPRMYNSYGQAMDFFKNRYDATYLSSTNDGIFNGKTTYDPRDDEIIWNLGDISGGTTEVIYSIYVSKGFVDAGLLTQLENDVELWATVGGSSQLISTNSEDVSSKVQSFGNRILIAPASQNMEGNVGEKAWLTFGIYNSQSGTGSESAPYLQPGYSDLYGVTFKVTLPDELVYVPDDSLNSSFSYKVIDKYTGIELGDPDYYNGWMHYHPPETFAPCSFGIGTGSYPCSYSSSNAKFIAVGSDVRAHSFERADGPEFVQNGQELSWYIPRFAPGLFQFSIKVELTAPLAEGTKLYCGADTAQLDVVYPDIGNIDDLGIYEQFDEACTITQAPLINKPVLSYNGGIATIVEDDGRIHSNHTSVKIYNRNDEFVGPFKQTKLFMRLSRNNFQTTGLVSDYINNPHPQLTSDVLSNPVLAHTRINITDQINERLHDWTCPYGAGNCGAINESDHPNGDWESGALYSQRYYPGSGFYHYLGYYHDWASDNIDWPDDYKSMLEADGSNWDMLEESPFLVDGSEDFTVYVSDSTCEPGDLDADCPGINTIDPAVRNIYKTPYPVFSQNGEYFDVDSGTPVDDSWCKWDIIKNNTTSTNTPCGYRPQDIAWIVYIDDAELPISGDRTYRASIEIDDGTSENSEVGKTIGRLMRVEATSVKGIEETRWWGAMDFINNADVKVLPHSVEPEIKFGKEPVAAAIRPGEDVEWYVGLWDTNGTLWMQDSRMWIRIPEDVEFKDIIPCRQGACYIAGEAIEQRYFYSSAADRPDFVKPPDAHDYVGGNDMSWTETPSSDIKWVMVWSPTVPNTVFGGAQVKLTTTIRNSAPAGAEITLSAWGDCDDGVFYPHGNPDPNPQEDPVIYPANAKVFKEDFCPDDPVENSYSITTESDIAVSITKVGPPQMSIGSEVPFGISIENTGNDTVNNAYVIDRVPRISELTGLPTDETSFVSASDPDDTEPVTVYYSTYEDDDNNLANGYQRPEFDIGNIDTSMWSKTSPANPADVRHVLWWIGDFASLESYNLEFVVQPDEDSAFVVNNATLVSDQETITAQSNTVTISNNPIATVTKVQRNRPPYDVDAQTEIPAGVEFAYDLRITNNNENEPLVSVTLVDQLPVGIQVIPEYLDDECTVEQGHDDIGDIITCKIAESIYGQYSISLSVIADPSLIDETVWDTVTIYDLFGFQLFTETCPTTVLDLNLPVPPDNGCAEGAGECLILDPRIYFMAPPGFTAGVNPTWREVRSQF